ncbi:MAG: hypothetical protein Q7R93_04695 [bacterium]|nr:hypothetical protein [bacterium]
MKKLVSPFAVAVFLTFISGFVILPFPFEKQELFWAGYPEGNNITFEKTILWKPLDIFIKTTDFPSRLGYYDFHLSFKGTSSSLSDASKLIIFVKRDSDFWEVVKRELGEPDESISSNSMGGYELKVGDGVNIYAIPIRIPVEYVSGMIICDSADGQCPLDLLTPSVYWKSAIDAYIKPNFISLILQWTLIFAFWTVLINSLLGLYQKDWRRKKNQPEFENPTPKSLIRREVTSEQSLQAADTIPPMNIIEKAKELNFPPGEYVIVGSGPLEALGIRQASDIDVAVLPELFERLRVTGEWKEEERYGKTFLKREKVDIIPKLSWSEYPTTTEEAIASAIVIDGIYFMNLDELRKFKTALGREKDFADIALIDAYQQKHP